MIDNFYSKNVLLASSVILMNEDSHSHVMTSIGIIISFQDSLKWVANFRSSNWWKIDQMLLIDVLSIIIRSKSTSRHNTFEQLNKFGLRLVDEKKLARKFIEGRNYLPRRP